VRGNGRCWRAKFGGGVATCLTTCLSVLTNCQKCPFGDATWAFTLARMVGKAIYNEEARVKVAL
jgi:hypothetical protein